MRVTALNVSADSSRLCRMDVHMLDRHLLPPAAPEITERLTGSEAHDYRVNRRLFDLTCVL